MFRNFILKEIHFTLSGKFICSEFYVYILSIVIFQIILAIITYSNHTYFAFAIAFKFFYMLNNLPLYGNLHYFPNSPNFLCDCQFSGSSQKSPINEN
jgi:hypothetical protein